jgi:autotransporter-associated beta strand protein
MKHSSRLQRLLGRSSKGSHRAKRCVWLRPEVLLLEDRCLPSISLPASTSPIGQLVGGPFGDLWYDHASGTTIGHLATDGSVAEISVAGSTPQDIETDVYGNLWTVDPTNGVTLNRLTPDQRLLSFTNLNQANSVNDLSNPPDSFLPHLLVDSSGNASVVVVDQDGNANLVKAPMTTDTSALRTAWGALPVVAKQEGAVGETTALWYPDGAGISRLDFFGEVQHFSLPAGNTDVVASLGVGPDQNIWFVEASQDSSTGMYDADKVGELFPNGRIVDASLAPQGSYLKITGMVASPDGGSLWFDQVSMQSDGVNVQSGTHRIGQINIDKSVSYYAASKDGGPSQASAIGTDGSTWASTSTFDGSEYQTDVEQTPVSGLSQGAGSNIYLGHSPPQAGNLSVSTNQNTAVSGNLPATDNNGVTLQFSVQSIPDHGQVTINANGAYTYTPNGGYVGGDTFNFAVDDGRGGMAVATVSVTVTAVNKVSITDGIKEVSINSDPLQDFLPVSDLNGNPLDVTITSGTSHGTVSIQSNQGAPGGLGDVNFTYTPDSGYSGTDSFTYSASDGQGGTATGTMTFTPYVNQPPTAEDASVYTYVNGAISSRLPAFDPNGDFLTVTILSQPTHGYVSLPDAGHPGLYGDATYAYYPDADFVGTDSFTYQVDDGHGGTATGHMSVAVLPLANTVTIYADSHWGNLTAGTVVPNPDPLNSSAAPALFGYNAFPSINSAVSAAASIYSTNPSAGLVVVNGANGDTGSGIFHENVVDGSSVPVSIQQGLVTVDSLAGNNTASSIALHGVNLNAGAGNSSTEYDGTLTGAGGLTKSGTGSLILTGNNTYSGGTNVAGGTLKVASDANLGTGDVAGAAAGTLEFTGTTSTSKNFSMSSGTITTDAGKTLTFNGSQVSNATLTGAGTFATNATNGAQFSGVTSTSSPTINSNSGNDQFINFDNSATVNVAAGINTSGASTTKLFNGLTNESTGNITIGPNSQVNVASFHSYGVLTIAPGTDPSNGLYTLLTNSGASRLEFDVGSRTYISTPSHANFFDAGIDLHGYDAHVLEGLLVNNGFVIDSAGAGTKTVISDGINPVNNVPALVKGAGFFQNGVITINGGQLQSGNSPGSNKLGQLEIGPGGVTGYIFCINDATGAAGPAPDANGHVSGWSLVNVLGDFTWTANSDNKLVVNLQTLINPTTVGNDVFGSMDHFDPTQSYVWEAFHWAGTYDGPTDARALNDATVFNASAVANAAGGKFSWQLDTTAKTLSLVYTPPPAVAAVLLNSTDSGVGSITVAFSSAVNFAGGNAAAAFRLTNLDTGVLVDLTATVTTDSSGRTVVTLTFGGGVLASGHYRLNILGNAVTGSDGMALDGSGTGTGNGVDYVGPIWTIG